MVKLNNVLRKLDNIDYLLQLYNERSIFLEKENEILRLENLRLLNIQKELVRELGERIFKRV